MSDAVKEHCTLTWSIAFQNGQAGALRLLPICNANATVADKDLQVRATFLMLFEVKVYVLSL
jgi:hypothetical protein